MLEFSRLQCVFHIYKVQKLVKLCRCVSTVGLSPQLETMNKIHWESQRIPMNFKESCGISGNVKNSKKSKETHSFCLGIFENLLYAVSKNLK